MYIVLASPDRMYQQLGMPPLHGASVVPMLPIAILLGFQHSCWARGLGSRPTVLGSRQNQRLTNVDVEHRAPFLRGLPELWHFFISIL